MRKPDGGQPTPAHLSHNWDQSQAGGRNVKNDGFAVQDSASLIGTAGIEKVSIFTFRVYGRPMTGPFPPAFHRFPTFRKNSRDFMSTRRPAFHQHAMRRTQTVRSDGLYVQHSTFGRFAEWSEGTAEGRGGERIFGLNIHAGDSYCISDYLVPRHSAELDPMQGVQQRK